MKKLVSFVIGVVVVLVVVIVALFSIYNYNIGPVSRDKELKEVVIGDGETYLTIAPILKENNLIKSEFFYKLYIKLNKPDTFEAGIYQLSENMGVEEIVKKISEGSDYSGEIINITFIEGKNMRYIASIIDENTVNTTDDVFNLLDNEEYIDSLIEKYWFLTDDIKNDKIYYSLEGYLFPDTYQFLNKNVSVEEIFEKMLDNTEVKLDSIKDEINASEYSIHELLTLSSIVELEGAGSDDRASVAGVFYNRLNDGMSLGSDITGYYGAKMDDWTNGLGEHIDDCNGYNTRGECVIGLPVGPVCNPSLESILATINYEKHNYYYFVADCSGKTYLNSSLSGHEKTINKLKREDNWCDS